MATTALDETKESEPFGAAETSEGLNPEAPQKAAESTTKAQATYAKELALLIEPVQAVPFGEGYNDLETTFTQLSKERIKAKPKKQAIQASFCFVFIFMFFFMFFFIIIIVIPFFFNVGIIVMRYTE